MESATANDNICACFGYGRVFCALYTFRQSPVFGQKAGHILIRFDRGDMSEYWE
jgi:hypothetical protein